MWGQSIRSNMNLELRYGERGKMGPQGSKDARKAMRAAEIAYQKELGIYKPTLGERIRALFQKGKR